MFEHFENFETGLPHPRNLPGDPFNHPVDPHDLADKGPNEPNDLAYYPSWAEQKPGGRNYALASLTY